MNLCVDTVSSGMRWRHSYSPRVFLAVVQVESLRRRRHGSTAERRAIVGQGVFQGLELDVGGHGVRGDLLLVTSGIYPGETFADRGWMTHVVAV